MAHYRDRLFSRAFEVVPGSQYNQASHRLRETQNFVFYEAALRPDAPWEFLRDRVYPALARYLESKSLDPEMGSGGVVSLFFQDRFYLLTASEFLKTYAEIEGLDPEAFHSRVLGWLAEPEVRGENQERKQGEGDFRRDLPTIRK